MAYKLWTPLQKLTKFDVCHSMSMHSWFDADEQEGMSEPFGYALSSFLSFFDSVVHAVDTDTKAQHT